MPVVNKHSEEVFGISYDFLGALNDTEEIVLATSSVTVTDKNNVDATSSLVVPASVSLVGTTLHVTLQGGSMDESPYKLTFAAATDEDNHCYIQDVFIVVEDY